MSSPPAHSKKVDGSSLPEEADYLGKVLYFDFSISFPTSLQTQLALQNVVRNFVLYEKCVGKFGRVCCNPSLPSEAQPPSDLGVDIHTRRSQLQPPKRVGIIGNLYSLVQYKRQQGLKESPKVWLCECQESDKPLSKSNFDPLPATRLFQIPLPRRVS